MSFYTEVIQQDPRFHTKESVRDMEMLEPTTRAAVESIIAGAAAKGIQLRVTETYRSEERQVWLWEEGSTQLQTVGVHHFGLAADFCKIIGGTASWQGDWAFLGPLCAEFGMIWGGDWGEPEKAHSFRDYDHVQRCSVAQQNALFAGTWYPDSEVA